MGQPKPQARAGLTKLGRYELVTLIGQGGMAEVHLAVQRGPAGFEKLVVVKLVHQHLATQRAFVDMLLDEGRLAGMIKHPNVVDVYDLGEADGRYFVAMEYLDGEPLLALLRSGADGKRLDPLSTARVIADTAEGLEAAHRLKSRDGKPLGLVHHDVSLGNIVVLYTGVVKLVDFGVAKARTADKHDRIQGKFSYMAPEKLTEGAEVDRRSDIWSLGVVAWEALTLQRLFKGDDDKATVRQVLDAPIRPPSEACGDLPKDFDPIVMKALERDPTQRYSTAKAFSLDLEEVLRKRGYGSRNDRIASYMETTFAKQIAVRERLLHDISEGKRPEQMEATIEAFHESATRTITSTGDGRPLARPSDLVVDDAPARRSDPSWSGSHRAAGIKGLQQWVDESRKQRPFPWRAVVPLAAAIIALIVVLVIAGSDKHATSVEPPAQLQTIPPPPPKPVPVKPAPPPAPPPVPQPANVVPEPPVEPAPADDEIEMAPDRVPAAKLGSAARKPPPAKPTESADVLHARGLDQFRKGDPRAALASFNDARRVDPNFAPAWHGLGLVHESLGNKGPAKSAYVRYLMLAPNAANAGEIRARLTKL